MASISSRPPALLLIEPALIDPIFGPELLARLGSALQLTIRSPAGSNRREPEPDVQARAEVIVSSWGMPRMNAEFLAQYGRLKVVFYAAGSARGFVTPASWQRGVRVFTAAAANAIPVAEFVFAQVILGLKQVWPQVLAVKANKGYVHREHCPPGAYQSTVGLIALGHVGRLVAQRLRTLEVTTLAYDPFVSPQEADALGVRLCSLDELFATAHVVSCHLPELPNTAGLLRAEHFRALRRGATFLNTSRGSVVREHDLVAVLRERPDLLAVLDVTDPEPPRPDDPLYGLPNVLLTPHLAGSVGGECRRLGRSAVEDVERYVAGVASPNEMTRVGMENAA